jgi:hypothetical protein
LQSREVFIAEFATTRPLNYVNIANVAFSAYWLARHKASAGRNLVRLCGGLGFLTTLGSADRTIPFAAISWAFFASEYATTRLAASTRSALMRLGGFAAGLSSLFVLLAEWLGKTIENNVSMQRYVSLEQGDAAAPLVMPYVYLTGNIPAFQEFMRHRAPATTMGTSVFLPFVKVARFFSPTFEPVAEVREYEFIPFPFNTMTWLDSFWLDFGLIGVFAMPFFVGLLSSLVLVKATARATFGAVTLLGLCCYVAINSPFVNKLSSSPTWQFVLMITAIHLVIRLTMAASRA